MTASRSRLLAALLLPTALFLASCAAPVSYRTVAEKPPQGNFTQAPLSDAIGMLNAGKASKDPLVASGHFLECARLATGKALAGETGAVALYNHAVARLVESLQQANALPWGRSVTLGTGSSARTLRGKLEPGAPAVTREYIACDRIEFQGKWAKTRATRPGVGAAFVAASPQDPNFRATYSMPAEQRAITAVVRFEGSRSASLELVDPYKTERIPIAGRTPTLAADFSAPVSMGLAIGRPDKLGLRRLINPQKYSDTARLVRLQEYDPNRIPVLFVHGLQDTPASWASMYHSLLQDPVIRERYQFWVFSYPSGYPYPYSGSLLRKELEGIDRVFPGHKDIVLVGHSMGSLISRLMVTDADDKLWHAFFGKAPAQTQMPGSSRQLLEDSLVFHSRPDVHRVIFFSAPHRGSVIASNWIGRLGSRLVHIPSFLTDVRNSISSTLTVDAAAMHLDRAPNSVDTLSPNNGFVIQINKLPISPGVTYHSVIGDRGKGNTPNSSDGVVAYWSSHLDGAASEKIVPSDHGSHIHPDGIAEAHRILMLHLKQAR